MSDLNGYSNSINQIIKSINSPNPEEAVKFWKDIWKITIGLKNNPKYLKNKTLDIII